MCVACYGHISQEEMLDLSSGAKSVLEEELGFSGENLEKALEKETKELSEFEKNGTLIPFKEYLEEEG